MKNQILRCECVDMSVDGLGIARTEGPVVFVKGLIKGETADVRIIAEKKNYSVGIIDDLIVPSEHRRDIDCPIAHKCGGCDYRHIDYPYQLQLKKEVLINTFRDIAEVEDVLPCEDPYFYRNKVQVPVRDHKMGFYRSHSNDIVGFDRCLIQSQTADAIISDLKKMILNTPVEDKIRHILIKHAMGTDEIMVAFIVRDLSADLSQITASLTAKHPQIRSVLMNLNDTESNVILGYEEVLLYGRDHIFDEFDSIRVKLSLKSFYQVNRTQMIRLYAKVKELADLDKEDDVLDLYCGIGTISLYLSRFAKHVTGVEIVKEAVDNAKDNALLNGIDNVDFVLADAGKGMDRYLDGKDAVILDPPRKGVSRQLIDALIASRIKKIVYVSCNPATLARDLKLLKDDYTFSHIYPVDMFPHTVHCESVVLLTGK